MLEDGPATEALHHIEGKLTAREGNAKLPALFSTHPLSDARKAQLDTAIAALPARTYAPLEVDWASVTAAVAK